MASKQSIAAKEGYKLIGTQDLLNGVEGRARQLESELAAHKLVRAEAEAVGDEAAVKEHDEAMAVIQKRLTVVHERLDALNAEKDTETTK